MASKQKSNGGKKPSSNGKSPGYMPRVVVKFQDYVELPYEDNAEKYFEKYQVGPWKHLCDKYKGIDIKRLITSVDEKKLRSMIDRATEMDSTYKPPNFFNYYMIESPANVKPMALAKSLSRWNTVQTAYYDPPGSEPTVAPADEPRFGNQGYLDPAPDGIDAEFAWPRTDGSGFTGGDGAGLNIIDLERGWTLNHEDLTAQGATLLHGTIRDGSRAHGTSVLGEICAVDNTIGCVGITPNVASVDVVSYWGSSRVNAIISAIDNLQFGDVLLLEAQLTPAGETSPFPIEVLDAEFDAIRLASALGIVVVEAAGNGSNDLDAYTNTSGDNILNRASADYRDSGAIMVGASTSTTPHTPMGFTNFGSRVDCYAWGEDVDTCSSNSTGGTTQYTGAFNGTSSASPIITGAAVSLQGIAESNLGYRFSPWQMRDVLSDPANGTASNNPVADEIGSMPDLRAILNSNVLNLAPDIYIRDHTGDDGDPHTGPISASPDIILQPAMVADPQTDFGEGSGTENNNMLGYQAEAGQDNYIYVRVRNRGGSPATNAVATVFWSPVSTMLTPDLWTLVGSVAIPNVPGGDLLTVSDQIVWPAAAIPAEGHYCFVGIIGSEGDPAPEAAEFLNWTNYQNFIRENNNVTWRNFNVVDNEPDPASDDPAGFVALPFLSPGMPDRARRMALEVVGKLPKGARMMLETPIAMIDAMHEKTPFVKFNKKLTKAHVPVNPFGRRMLGEAVFPARARNQLRLLVHIPEEFRKNEYEVAVRQLYKGGEVGRVTWRLAPKERIKACIHTKGKMH